MSGNEGSPSTAMNTNPPFNFHSTNQYPVDRGSNSTSRYSMSSNGEGSSFTRATASTFDFDPMDYTYQSIADKPSMTTDGTSRQEEDRPRERIDTLSQSAPGHLGVYSNGNLPEENEPFAMTYLANYNALPTHRPPGYPHIIENDYVSEDEGLGYHKLRAADGVATLLYRYSTAALDSFLDFSKKEFFFWRREPAGEPAIHHTIIIRHGLTVSAGRIRQGAPSEGGGRWDYMLQYKIKPDGLWKPYALLQMLGEGWTRDPQEIDDMGNIFAHKIILDKRWRHYQDVYMGHSTSASVIRNTRAGKGPIKLDLGGDPSMPAFGYAYKELTARSDIQG